MRIAIIGAGPAGCTLACFLAQRGLDCVLFDNDQTPPLLVGESLVPAAIPYLKRLGIEEQVARISQKKCGAAFRHPSGIRVDFRFRPWGRGIPDYSYNIPRPQFDQLLREHTRALGVRWVSAKASVVVGDRPERDIELTPESLALAGLSEQPDFLVDASGRHRLFSHLLSLNTQNGDRNDQSYFAHYKGFDSDAEVEGQVVLSIIDGGWAWQIPLKNTLSVGVVVDRDVARNYGESASERLENIIDADPVLSISGKHRQRVTQVMRYSNYQQVTQEGCGNNWALLGDAYGFVDPMLSPGVFMAFESAARLEHALLNNHSKNKINHACLKQYCKEMDQWHDAWRNVIEYFYDGRLLGLFQAGQNVAQHASLWSPTRLMEWHIRRVISAMVSGAATCSKYNQQALYYSCQHLLSEDIQAEEYKMKPLERAGKRVSA